MSDSIVAELLSACYRASGQEGFPCNSSPIVAVALSLAAGLSGILMVLFLVHRVSGVLQFVAITCMVRVVKVTPN